MKDNITYKIESLLKKITKVGFCALSSYKAQKGSLEKGILCECYHKTACLSNFLDTLIKSIL